MSRLEDSVSPRPSLLQALLAKLARSNFLLHVALVGTFFLSWHLLTQWKIAPEFFFGRPHLVLGQIWVWFSTGYIYPHLWTSLLETILAFVFGTSLGIIVGLWLGLAPKVGRLLDPYITVINATPRVILAPIFIVWFGLGIWSKVMLAMVLVFCIVFFSVYQGVREVSPTLIANARMLGASPAAMLRKVYIPSALSWVFSSLHASVGMAFAGAVVGEYLGSSRGIGYLILQAEGTFDINAVYAGIMILTAFALLLDAIVTAAERRYLVWQPRAGE